MCADDTTDDLFDAPEIPPDCRRFRARLILGLDEATALPSSHPDSCCECRTWQIAEERLRLLLTAPPPQPPTVDPAFVSVLLQDLRRERRKRQVRRLGLIGAVAASIAFLLWQDRDNEMIPPPPTPPAIVAAVEAKQLATLGPESVVDQAYDSIRRLALSTATDADLRTRSLLPKVPVEGMIGTATPLPNSLTQAEESLAKTRLGAAAGLSPITNSTTRVLRGFHRRLTSVTPSF